METLGVFGPEAEAYLREVGRCVQGTSGVHMSYAHLLQRVAVAVERGNTVAVLGSAAPYC